MCRCGCEVWGARVPVLLSHRMLLIHCVRVCVCVYVCFVSAIYRLLPSLLLSSLPLRLLFSVAYSTHGVCPDSIICTRTHTHTHTNTHTHTHRRTHQYTPKNEETLVKINQKKKENKKTRRKVNKQPKK